LKRYQRVFFQRRVERWCRLTIVVLSAILTNCTSRLCDVLDIGSNLGLIALHALNLGARVTAIEPQVDLLCALRASAQENGFDSRLESIWGSVALFLNDTRLYINNGLYRYGGFLDIQKLYTSLKLPANVPQILFNNILLQPKQYEFVKIDTDSIDCSILKYLLRAVEMDLVYFRAVPLEIWAGEECEDKNLGSMIFSLQNKNYSVI